MTNRSERRSPRTSSRRLARATPTGSCGAFGWRARRTPHRTHRARRAHGVGGSRAQRDPLEMGKLPPRQAIALFEQRLYGFPDRQDIRMFVSLAEPTLDPREDLDVGQTAVDA